MGKIVGMGVIKKTTSEDKIKELTATIKKAEKELEELATLKIENADLKSKVDALTVENADLKSKVEKKPDKKDSEKAKENE